MMDENEIPGFLWSSFPNYDNFHRGEPELNLLLFIQQLQSYNFVVQAVDSEDKKEEVVVIKTNQLQSSECATESINFEDEVVVNETNQLRSSNFAAQTIDFENKERRLLLPKPISTPSFIEVTRW